MKIYIVNAFTNEFFSGNQAGVVLMDSDVSVSDEIWMQNVAKELKHSETAFIYRIAEELFRIRYFTTECEVPLCGHATIATFSLMNQEGLIADGTFSLITNDDTLQIQVKKGQVWMQMAKPEEVGNLPNEMVGPLYEAYGLDMKSDRPSEIIPKIIKVGIVDIILPVNNRDTLLRVKQNAAKVSEISKKCNVAGVHMFCISNEKDITAYCSNFAPLFGIDEECATGTANAGLTYYLHKYGLLNEKGVNFFIQGEHMNRKCQIMSRLKKKEDDVEIFIGGSAVIMMELNVRF